MVDPNLRDYSHVQRNRLQVILDALEQIEALNNASRLDAPTVEVRLAVLTLAMNLHHHACQMAREVSIQLDRLAAKPCGPLLEIDDEEETA